MRVLIVSIILATTAVLFADEAATTKPADFDPDKYRAAMERLNSKAPSRPTTSPATAPSVFRTPSALMVGAPGEARPKRNDRWTEFTRPKMNKWLEDTAVGSAIEFQCQLQEVSATRIPKPENPNETIGWKLTVLLKPMPFQFGDSPHNANLASYNSSPRSRAFILTVDEATAKRALNAKPGQPITVTGTIMSASIVAYDSFDIFHVPAKPALRPIQPVKPVVRELEPIAALDISIGKPVLSGAW